jgi:hypothetical protein
MQKIFACGVTDLLAIQFHDLLDSLLNSLLDSPLDSLLDNFAVA